MPKRKGNDDVKKLFLDAGAEVIEETHMRPFNGVNGCRCDSFSDRKYAVLAAIPTALASRKWVRKLKPDLVHLNTSVLPFAGLGAKLAGVGAPVVTHVRESLLRSWWGRILAFFNRRFSDWYVGIDQSGLDTIGDLTNQSIVIHNSVDTSGISIEKSSVNELRTQFNCDDETVVFGSICRIMSANGVLHFAEFLAEWQSKLPTNVRFVFCGFDDSNIDYVESARAAIEKSECAFAMDFTKDIGSILGASDVILAPFLTSHSSRAVIEGASIGKPALVSDLPNLREQISLNESGLIFQYEQPETIIEAIKQLSDRQKTMQMGKAALKFANQNFSLAVNKTKINDFYSKVLEDK